MIFLHTKIVCAVTESETKNNHLFCLKKGCHTGCITTISFSNQSKQKISIKVRKNCMKK